MNLSQWQPRHRKSLLTAIVAMGCCLMTIIAAAAAWAEFAIPKYTGYVNDQAGMMSPQARNQLEETLRNLDATDSTQVAILTVETLEGLPVEEYAIKVAESWKMGRQGKDNGVLLLVAKQERKIRIEVGRGLEGSLTDLQAGRIADKVIAPRFKEKKIDEGFAAGVAAITGVIKGEFEREGGAAAYGSKRHRRGGSLLGPGLLIAAMVFLGLASVSRVVGAAVGATALPLFTFLGLGMSFSLVTLLLLVGGGALAGLLLAGLLAGAGRHGGFGGGMFPGGFGGGSGGFGGSSGGFGGFDGGSFGGGGASSDW